MNSPKNEIEGIITLNEIRKLLKKKKKKELPAKLIETKHGPTIVIKPGGPGEYPAAHFRLGAQIAIGKGDIGATRKK